MSIDEGLDKSLEREINGIENNEYQANGYDYTTDELGRITHASGDLRLEQGDRDPKAQLLAGGADRLDADDGGHLVATRFGGAEGLENLQAEDRFVNRGAFKTIENEWADALEDKAGVAVDVMPYYADESERPSALIADYTISCEGQPKYTDYFSTTNLDLRGDEFNVEQFDLTNEESAVSSEFSSADGAELLGNEYDKDDFDIPYSVAVAATELSSEETETSADIESDIREPGTE